MQVYNEFKGQNVVFIGLTGEGSDTLSESQDYIDDFGIQWVNGYGAMTTIDALEVEAFPTKLVFGTDGKVAWHDSMSGNLSGAIRRALAN